MQATNSVQSQYLAYFEAISQKNNISMLIEGRPTDENWKSIRKLPKNPNLEDVSKILDYHYSNYRRVHLFTKKYTSPYELPSTSIQELLWMSNVIVRHLSVYKTSEIAQYSRIEKFFQTIPKGIDLKNPYLVVDLPSESQKILKEMLSVSYIGRLLHFSRSFLELIGDIQYSTLKIDNLSGTHCIHLFPGKSTRKGFPVEAQSIGYSENEHLSSRHTGELSLGQSRFRDLCENLSGLAGKTIRVTPAIQNNPIDVFGVNFRSPIILLDAASKIYSFNLSSTGTYLSINMKNSALLGNIHETGRFISEIFPNCIKRYGKRSIRLATSPKIVVLDKIIRKEKNPVPLMELDPTFSTAIGLHFCNDLIEECIDTSNKVPTALLRFNDIYIQVKESGIEFLLVDNGQVRRIGKYGRPITVRK